MYGLSNVSCNIINLSDEHNDRVVYAAAHTAVIYDKHTRRQTFLQVVGCIAVTLMYTKEIDSDGCQATVCLLAIVLHVLPL